MLNQSFLERVKKTSLERVSLAKKHSDIRAIRALALNSRKPISFVEKFLQTKGPRIIAEVKRQSPSHGAIAIHLDPIQIATSYANAGAAAISVLTEPMYFDGHLDDLSKIRNKLPHMPLLMKDFIVDPFQFFQARIIGADAILLMHSLLGFKLLKEFYALAVNLELTPLVEVHDENEFQNALDMGAQFIGVNNRNLNSLLIDLQVSKNLSQFISSEVVVISESGISLPSEVKELTRYGYDGFLIGTALTHRGEPGKSLSEFLRGCNED